MVSRFNFKVKSEQKLRIGKAHSIICLVKSLQFWHVSGGRTLKSVFISVN